MAHSRVREKQRNFDYSSLERERKAFTSLLTCEGENLHFRLPSTIECEHGIVCRVLNELDH